MHTRPLPASCLLASLICLAPGVACTSTTDGSKPDKPKLASNPTDAAPALAEAGSDAVAVCSGCPSDVRPASDMVLRVHHVHLNVKDAPTTIAFYEKFFAARKVRLNGKADALWADPLLLLLQEGDFDFSDTLQYGFEHIGMGVKDPTAWFEMAAMEGIMADPRNGAPESPVSFPITPGSVPFFDPGVDTFSYIYVRGPNSERVETWSGLARFRHTHFMTPDIDTTVAWYQQLLGVKPMLAMADPGSVLSTNGFSLDDVQLNFLSPATPEDYVKADDQPVGHIAFSVPDLDAMFEHAKSIGATIVSEPADTPLGFRSFFVRAPQEVLLEFVAAGKVVVP